MLPSRKTINFFRAVHNKIIMIVVIILLLVETVFPFPTITEIPTLGCKRTHLWQAANTNVESPLENNQSDAEGNDWELMEDWILQDKVPQFTVQSSHRGWKGAEALTFWAQLRHSTPELSARTELELEKRYRMISSDDEKNNPTSASSQCGPSPPLLSNWWMQDIDTENENGKKSTINVGGTLSNGSRIWFPFQSAGCLGEDPAGNDAMSLENNSSGYVVAAGGSIYELGTPRNPKYVENMFNIKTGIALEQSDQSNSNSVEPTGLSKAQFEKSVSGIMEVLVHKIPFALGAIVAASLISVVAFEAGSIHTEEVIAAKMAQTHRVLVVARTNPQRDISQDNGPLPDVPQLSISELRARAELKVGRDKRNLVVIQDRLNRDEVRLEELRKEETRLEAAEYGF